MTERLNNKKNPKDGLCWNLRKTSNSRTQKTPEIKLSVLLLKAAHLLGHEGVWRRSWWSPVHGTSLADFLRSLQSHVRYVSLLWAPNKWQDVALHGSLKWSKKYIFTKIWAELGHPDAGCQCTADQCLTAGAIGFTELIRMFPTVQAMQEKLAHGLAYRKTFNGEVKKKKKTECRGRKRLKGK